MTLDNFIYHNSIQKADAIKVAKSYGLLTHYVIYLGRESEYTNTGLSGGYRYGGRNRHLFIANMTGGVQVIPEEEALKFLETYSPTGINRFRGNAYDRELAINRALSKLNGESYNLILNNCEHFANYVQTGTASSGQSQAGVVLGLLALLGIGAMFLSGDDDDKDRRRNS
jgi:Lecithin retinol acyltransferase